MGSTGQGAWAGTSRGTKCSTRNIYTYRIVGTNLSINAEMVVWIEVTRLMKNGKRPVCPRISSFPDFVHFFVAGTHNDVAVDPLPVLIHGSCGLWDYESGYDAADTMGFVMPSGLHRTYGADHLHFITCSCYRRCRFSVKRAAEIASLRLSNRCDVSTGSWLWDTS